MGLQLLGLREIASLQLLEIGQDSVLRRSPTRSPLSGGFKWDRRIFPEEVPREIAILRSQEKFSGRSGRRPESVFGGSIGWNRDSPVLAPLVHYNIKGEDGGTGESPSGRLPERLESSWAGLSNIVPGPRGLTGIPGNPRHRWRDLCGPHF